MVQLSDLTKLQYFSPKDAFKNNDIFTGSFNISGTASEGLNIVTQTVDLGRDPDMLDIIFNGTDDPLDVDLRPSDGWFKEGFVYVLGDDLPTYDDYPTNWKIFGSITGTVLTIEAIFVQQFIATLTLTSTPVYYRVIDYSVF